jgi:hypothetical protein
MSGSATFGSGTTWTTPSNFKNDGQSYAELYGGGGGGGYGNGVLGGGGGGGGGFGHWTYAINPNSQISIGVGSGGASGSNPGGTTSFWQAWASGGRGGGNVGGGGGDGGGYYASWGHGGGHGAGVNYISGGGGGGCAGTNGDGNAGYGTNGGLGNGGYAGAGGQGGTGLGNGNGGGSYGGGGGGSGAYSSNAGWGYSGYVYTWYNTYGEPYITSINPTSVWQTNPGSITIYGGNLGTLTQVNVDGYSVNVTGFGDGYIIATLNNLKNGWGYYPDITVWTQNWCYSTTYNNQLLAKQNAPSIDTIYINGGSSNPRVGFCTGGDRFALGGNYFTTINAIYVQDGGGNWVICNSLSVANDTYVSCVIPPITQTNPFYSLVKVVNQYTYYQTPGGYNWWSYKPNLPSLTDETPTILWQSSPASIAVNGHYFTTVTGATIGGVAASSIAIANDSYMTIQPAGITQQNQIVKSVVISNPSGSNSFNVTFNPNNPVLSSVVPTIIDEGGGSGNMVTLSGYFFGNISSVKFGSQSASSYSIISNTSMTATPNSALSPNLGAETLTIYNSTGLNASQPFTWTYNGDYTSNMLGLTMI